MGSRLWQHVDQKNNMNILGIDYGKKRIGVSWVDTDMGMVLPLTTVESGKWKVDLVSMIGEQKADKLVIGLPIGLDGKENENTKNIRKFAEDLKSLVNLPIEFVDERFTSRQADAMGGTASRDEKSAMVILQSYLDKVKSNPG